MTFALLFTGCFLILIGNIGKEMKNERIEEFGECFGYATFCSGLFLGLLEVGERIISGAL